jgi:hypothetical protein
VEPDVRHRRAAAAQTGGSRTFLHCGSKDGALKLLSPRSTTSESMPDVPLPPVMTVCQLDVLD